MSRLFLLVLLLQVPGSAATLPLCVQATLLDYFNLGSSGCGIGDKMFFDFAPLSIPGGAAPIDPGDVVVQPVNTPLQPELWFLFNTTAGAGVFLDIRFGYTVDVMPGGPPIQALSLRMTGASATGDGAVTVITDACFGAAFAGDLCLSPGATLITFATSSASQLTDQTGTPLITRMGVINDIGIDGGLSGTAALASAVNHISEVPEPASALLAAAGLLGAAWLRRRR